MYVCVWVWVWVWVGGCVCVYGYGMGMATLRVGWWHVHCLPALSLLVQGKHVSFVDSLGRE